MFPKKYSKCSSFTYEHDIPIVRIINNIRLGPRSWAEQTTMWLLFHSSLISWVNLFPDFKILKPVPQLRYILLFSWVHWWQPEVWPLFPAHVGGLTWSQSYVRFPSRLLMRILKYSMKKGWWKHQNQSNFWDGSWPLWKRVNAHYRSWKHLFWTDVAIFISKDCSAVSAHREEEEQKNEEQAVWFQCLPGSLVDS